MIGGRKYMRSPLPPAQSFSPGRSLQTPGAILVSILIPVLAHRGHHIDQHRRRAVTDMRDRLSKRERGNARDDHERLPAGTGMLLDYPISVAFGLELSCDPFAGFDLQSELLNSTGIDAAELIDWQFRVREVDDLFGEDIGCFFFGAQVHGKEIWTISHPYMCQRR